MISAKVSAVTYIILTAMALAGLLILYVGAVAVCAPSDVNAFLAPFQTLCTQGDAFTTLAQIVPATVIALFIFGLGMVFVVAQMIIPGRGSRSLTPIFRYLRMQFVFSFGLVLLAGSIWMTGTADDKPSKNPDGWFLGLLSDIALWIARVPDWESSTKRQPHLDFASGLAFATILYVLIASACIISVFVAVIDPARYSKRLDEGPFYGRLSRKDVPVGDAVRKQFVKKRWTSEQMYESLRIYRGWLRTVNRGGESRDLVFCIRGFVQLVDIYAKQIVADQKEPGKDRRDADYGLAKLPNLRKKAADLAEEERQPDHPMGWNDVTPHANCQGRCACRADPNGTWFANEVRRALVRAIESGLAAGTLRRDLDRMLDTFDEAFIILFTMSLEAGQDQASTCARKVQVRPWLCDDLHELIIGMTEVAIAVGSATAEQRGLV